ncbi:MAG TPA: TIGR04086 family membrane protein [Herpetosiphonaceae bacterium]
MRTIVSAPGVHTIPGAGRGSRLGALGLGVLVGTLTAIVGGLVLALLGLSTGGWLAVALMLLAVCAGGWLAARRTAGSGWRPGLYVGLLLAMLTLTVTLVSGESLDLGGVVTVLAVCAAAGALGGWLSGRIWWRRGQA